MPKIEISSCARDIKDLLLVFFLTTLFDLAGFELLANFSAALTDNTSFNINFQSLSISGFDPAEKIAIFRIPGSWEEEGFALLERYGVDYVDRSVSMHEAAQRAVQKMKGS